MKDMHSERGWAERGYKLVRNKGKVYFEKMPDATEIDLPAMNDNKRRHPKRVIIALYVVIVVLVYMTFKLGVLH